MKRLAAALVLVACHREVRKQEHERAEEKVKTAKATEIKVAETKVRGSVDTDTTHEVLALVVEESSPTGPITVLIPVSKNRPVRLNPGARIVGTVPLAQTFTHKHVDPSTEKKDTEKKSTEAVDSKKKSTKDTKAETDTDVGFSWKFYGFCFLAGVAVLVSLYAYLKFIKKVGWL